MEYSTAEKEQAAEQLGRLGWGDDYWNSWCGSDQEAETRRIASGSGVLIPASRLIPLQCELNRAVELLRRYPRIGGVSAMAWDNSRCDFLSHYPEGELR